MTKNPKNIIMIIFQIVLLILPLFILVQSFLIAKQYDLTSLMIPLFGALGVYLSFVFLLIHGKEDNWRGIISNFLRSKILTRFAPLISTNLLLIIAIILLSLISIKGPSLKIRGEVVINRLPIQGAAKINVVGLNKKYYSDLNGLFNFKIKDERQEQLTLRGQFNNWIGSKVVSRGNLLSVELPLTAQRLDVLDKSNPGKLGVAFFSSFSIGESANKYILNDRKSLYTEYFVKNLVDNKLISISNLSHNVYQNLEERIGKLNSPVLWVSNIELLNEDFIESKTSTNQTSYAVSVGINNYKDQNIKQLAYSVNDAQEFNRLFQSAIENYKAHLLLDSHATLYNLKKTLNTINVGNKNIYQLIIYLSGHLIRDSKGGRVYFLLYDSKLSNYKMTALPLDELMFILNKKSFKRLIVVVDGGMGLS